jgi:hypothetical protein
MFNSKVIRQLLTCGAFTPGPQTARHTIPEIDPGLE